MTTYNPVSPEFLAEVEAVIGKENVFTDPDKLDMYKTDEEYDPRRFRVPEAVVRPGNAEEIAAIVKLCNKYMVPITVRSGGTSLAAGAIAVCGGISLCWWYLRTFLKIGQFKVDCDACVSCGQCAKICPVGNIKMVNGRPAFGDNCTTCLACVHWCPKHAIQMGSVNKMGTKRYVNPNIKIQEMFNQEGK